MKILYLAPIAFNRLKQRPQHIAELLSKKHEVWYIEPTISFMKYILKGGRSFKKEEYNINSCLHVLKLNGRFTTHISLQAFDLFGLNTISEKIQLNKLIDKCDAIWVGYCGWYDVISGVKNKKIIYDKMDDDKNITQNKLLKKLIIKVEPKLIKKANIIFVTAMKFYQELSLQGDKVYYVPNAFHRELENENKNMSITKIADKKVFGYIGTIAHWFDQKAIETILNADKNNVVVIVGPCEVPKINHDRVEYVGTIPKNKIGEYIDSFDICLFPFIQNDFLDTIDPVKIYEYLALNKPVIAVDSMETRKFGKLINRYINYEELKDLSTSDLDIPFQDEVEIKNYLLMNTWDKRVDIILEKI